MSRNEDETNEATRSESAERQTPADERIASVMFNEHDTPPPILFMQGSCIIEVSFIDSDTKAAGEVTFEEISSALAAAGAFIAHVKVVDGSGDMLFRFDNISEDRLTINFRLQDVNQNPAGQLSFSLEAGAMHPGDKKIVQKPNDPAMNTGRLRFRCLRADTEEDVNISGVLIEYELACGSLPLYNLSFNDLRSKGVELKVMLWLEQHKTAARGSERAQRAEESSES